MMSRGDRREEVFRDNADRNRFLETLGRACGKTGWQVHAYCLLTNHFHLVMETPRMGMGSDLHFPHLSMSLSILNLSLLRRSFSFVRAIICATAV